MNRLLDIFKSWLEFLMEMTRANFDKMLWAGLAIFFTFICVHLVHHGTTDDKVLAVMTGGVGAALSALGILSNVARLASLHPPDDGKTVRSTTTVQETVERKSELPADPEQK